MPLNSPPKKTKILQKKQKSFAIFVKIRLLAVALKRFRLLTNEWLIKFIEPQFTVLNFCNYEKHN